MLTARDLEILAMTYRYDGLVVDLLRRRFWPSSGARSACYDRVARLTVRGYLRATRLPSLTGQGSGKTFLTLGPRGRTELAGYLDDPSSARRRNDPAVTPLFVAHHVSACNVRLTLERAAHGAAGVELTDWTTERELRSHPLRVEDPTTATALPIVPDGAFTLRLDRGGEQRFYLELDMGTVAPKRMRAKLRAYFLLAPDPIVPVLFVVPNRARLVAISRWATEEADRLGADPTIIWLAGRSDLEESTVLATPVWHVAGVAEPQALAPSGYERTPEPVVVRGELRFRGGPS